LKVDKREPEKLKVDKAQMDMVWQARADWEF
jgi:hypothetical protein